MNRPSRRQYLHGVTAVGLGALTGCLGDGDSDTPSAQASGDDGTPTSTQTGTPQTPTQTDLQTDRPADGSPTPTSDPGTQRSPSGPATGTPTGPVEWWSSFDAGVTAQPVLDGDGAYAGSEGGVVRRYGLSAGEEQWSFDTGDPIQELAVSDDTVLVIHGTNELASAQTLSALDASDGTERWTFEPTEWWLTVLGVRDGVAYVATTDDAIGGSGQTLYEVALADGGANWSAEIGDPREALVREETVVVSVYGAVAAYERADGTRRWQREATDKTFGTLATVDGAVVYGHRRGSGENMSFVLTSRELASGEQRWQFDALDVTSAAVRDVTVYVGGEAVAALDPADGSTVWTADSQGFVTDAGVTADRVYAGGDAMQAYTREGGDRVWSCTPDPTQGGVFAAGVSDGTVWVDAYHDADPRNQYKFGVDAASGDGQWVFEDGTGLTGLAVDEGVGVVGGGNGRLYALA